MMQEETGAQKDEEPGWRELMPPLGPPLMCGFPPPLLSLRRAGPGLRQFASPCDGQLGVLHKVSAQ